MEYKSDTKVIMKNTIYLYFRQLLVLVIALFTTRVVLNILGIEDYGIYNLIYGVVTFLSIITSNLTSATQRFLSISIGKNDKTEIASVFNVSVTIYLLLSIVCIILAETIGLWFVNTQLVIPEERMFAANITYQCAIFSFFLGLIRAPYDAAIISYEKMNIYAIISLFSAVLQLLLVYLLLIIDFDHLIVYSILVLLSIVINNHICIVYCRKKLNIIFGGIDLNKQIFSSIFSFSFWMFFGSLSTLGVRQCINIFLNMKFGVAINAATSIATKISSQVYGLVANFTTAYKPQIIKLYAVNKPAELFNLVTNTTKISYYLYILLFIPIIYNMGNILTLWLKIVPDYTIIFATLLMFYLLIDALQEPLRVLVTAIGNIRKYQICFSIINIFNLPVMWFCLQWGAPAYVVYIVLIVFTFITTLYRILYVSKKTEFDIRSYVWCLLKLVLIGTFSCVVLYPIMEYFDTISGGVPILFVKLMACFIITSFIVLYIGLSKTERTKIFAYIKSKISKNASNN